jgi:hypothetical protein
MPHHSAQDLTSLRLYLKRILNESHGDHGDGNNSGKRRQTASEIGRYWSRNETRLNATKSTGGAANNNKSKLKGAAATDKVKFSVGTKTLCATRLERNYVDGCKHQQKQ